MQRLRLGGLLVVALLLATTPTLVGLSLPSGSATAYPTDEVDPYPYPSTPTGTRAPIIPHVSGTIRWVNASTWVALDDAGHTPTGISSVVLMSDRVRVNFTFSADEVSSFQATPDESFAAADVRVGASVALDHADIYFYMPSYGANPVPPSLLSRAGANVWLTGWFHLEE